jgi:phosphoribosylaminoimidazolecarboxamide formyltransferase/IMP cyclohydrolase
MTDPNRRPRIAVGVSGTGSNLRALVAAAGAGALDADVTFAFADRACSGLAWATEAGIDTALIAVPPAADEPGRAAADATLAETLQAVAPDLVVLAGYMRVLGPRTLAAFDGRVVNTHPSLLPAFPGAHAVRDALAAGVRVTGATVHLVDATLDGGPILAQDAVPVLPGDDEASLHERIKATEHRLLPRVVGELLRGEVRPRRRALLAVSDKAGLAAFAAELVGLGFELVSTGGTAAAMRAAGLPVTDVAAVTGSPEMLDGRVKTLHPRIHGGILADLRRADHRAALAAAGIEPFELVVVNLYPFAAALERPGVGLDGLIEEIDIGGPALIRAAAKNHASVAVVTSPARYDAIIAALREHGDVPPGLRAALAVEAFRRTAAYDARIALELPGRMAAAGVALPDEPGLPGAADPYPDSLTIPLEKVDALRYGENPHQAAARYRRPGSTAAGGPFATGQPPLQGKPLSYNNVLDASAAAATARLLDGAAVVIVKHTNPCGAAVRPTILDAWRDALAGDPVSAFGGVVAVTRPVDRALAEAMSAIFLEVVVAPAFDEAALAVLAAKSNLRLVVDTSLGGKVTAPSAQSAQTASSAQSASTAAGPDAVDSIRTAGGAVLVQAADAARDDPSTCQLASRRAPTDGERRDLELAWALVRGVVSNAIVLVRDGQQIGLGSGQTSRVDAARQAVAKACTFFPEGGAHGAVAASDAFFPFPDGPQALLEAGVTALVQPGGSVRDAEVREAVDAAGASMLLTGLRHFRH